MDTEEEEAKQTKNAKTLKKKGLDTLEISVVKK